MLPGSPALPANLLLGGIKIGPRNVSVHNDYPAGSTFHDYGGRLKVDYESEAGSLLVGHILKSIRSCNKYRMNDYQDGDATDWSAMPCITPGGPFSGGLIQYGSNVSRKVPHCV